LVAGEFVLVLFAGSNVGLSNELFDETGKTEGAPEALLIDTNFGTV
jgi:hypothetical protein